MNKLHVVFPLEKLYRWLFVLFLILTLASFIWLVMILAAGLLDIWNAIYACAPDCTTLLVRVSCDA